MGKCLERLYNGIIKENPTFVLILGDVLGAGDYPRSLGSMYICTGERFGG